MPVSQSKLARLTPNLGILWISVCSFWLCGSIVANPIIYRLVPSPSRYEIRQCCVNAAWNIRVIEFSVVFTASSHFWCRVQDGRVAETASVKKSSQSTFNQTKTNYGRFAYESFRLLSVRLRLESIRLRLLCQLAYVFDSVLWQTLIHLLDLICTCFGESVKQQLSEFWRNFLPKTRNILKPKAVS